MLIRPCDGGPRAQVCKSLPEYCGDVSARTHGMGRCYNSYSRIPGSSASGSMSDERELEMVMANEHFDERCADWCRVTADLGGGGFDSCDGGVAALGVNMTSVTIVGGGERQRGKIAGATTT